MLLAFVLTSAQLFAQCTTPDTLSITYSCRSSNQVNISAVTSSCVTNPHWNFGDSASGDLNTLAGATATHTFTASGAYIVTLTATGQNGEILTKTQPINIIGVTFNFQTSLLCYSKVYHYELEIIGGGSNYNLEVEYPYIGPFSYTPDSPPPYPNDIYDSVYGLYKVTVSAANTCPASASIYFSPPPPALAHTTSVTPANCSLSNGAITITESGGTPPYNYAWRPAVSSGTTASNLSKGYYSVTATDDNGCTDNFSVTVGTREAAITHKEAVKQPVCTANGAITISPSGGISPYNYSWTPAVSASSSASGLAGGTYNINIEDKNGCSEQVNIKLQQQTTALNVQTKVTAPQCGAADGSITLLPSRGTAPYQYAWALPVANNQATAHSLAAGTYQSAVTDVNGCEGAVTTTLYDQPLTVSLGKDTFLCDGNTITLSPGAFAAYRWNDLSTQPTLIVNAPGIYSVTVTNAGSCTAKADIVVEPGCGEIVFPSAFTPNGDLKNDLFGPVGSLSGITNYSLLIYNRYGGLVFRSQNPYDKWSGKVKDAQTAATGDTYIYIATFEFDGKKRIQKGTITLVL